MRLVALFAALVLLSLTGIAINAGLDRFGHWILRARGGA